MNAFAKILLPVVFIIVLTRLGAGETDALGMFLVLCSAALWILDAFENSRGIK